MDNNANPDAGANAPLKRTRSPRTRSRSRGRSGTEDYTVRLDPEVAEWFKEEMEGGLSHQIRLLMREVWLRVNTDDGSDLSDDD